MKQTIALVILCKNQSAVVEKTVQNLRAKFDAIYILDDYSEDQIANVAEKNGAFIYQRKLTDSFADHRNWILQKIKQDWTFFLDADEEMSPQLVEEIHSLIVGTNYVAFQVPRLDVFAGKVLHFGEVGNIHLVRLGRTKKGRWERAVHEVWTFSSGSIGQLEHPLLHNAHANISSFVQKLNKYAVLEKSERAGRGKARIIIEMFIYPSSKFVQNYIFKQGFRDGFAGAVYAVLMSYYSLIKRVFWYEDLTQ